MRKKRARMLELQTIFLIGLWLTTSGFVLPRITAHHDSPSLITFIIMNPERRYIQANFSSIQDAINEAENGSTIYVPPAIYYEHIV